MSVFKINLVDGRPLDPHNLQQIVTVRDASGRPRQFKNGEIFIGSHYWKQFPFVEVIEDDGREHGISVITKEFTFDTNITVNILELYSGYAVWTNITPDNDVICRVNNNNQSDFKINGDTTFTFGLGEVQISVINFTAINRQVKLILQFGLK